MPTGLLSKVVALFVRIEIPSSSKPRNIDYITQYVTLEKFYLAVVSLRIINPQ
jgi:hypothetical protein